MRGIDTTFLLQLEIVEAEGHDAARLFARETIWGRRGAVAVAPQILNEFIHIVTDGRRFQRPMRIEEALRRAGWWWEAPEVLRVYPNEESVRIMLRWMQQHNLGRKRVLDTQLAATYLENGVHEILSTNERDFSLFQGIAVIDPASNY